MPEEAINKEKKYRIIIYHGHLHKIPLDVITEELQEKKVITKEESIKQDTI